MNIDALKTQRKGLRTAFTLSSNKIEAELAKDDDLRTKTLSVLKTQLYDKFQQLDVCQKQISEILSQSKDAEQLFSSDFETVEEYRDNYLDLCARIDRRIQDAILPIETEK